MASSTNRQNADHVTVLFVSIAILALALFLQHAFNSRQALLFLTGTGLGISLLHAAFGFSSSWRNFIRNREGVGIRAQLLLFILVSLIFFPLIGHAMPQISLSAALGPVGISVLVGAFFFGIGMELGNGCGSGTLYTVGGGHVNMLVTLLFFIIGSLIGTAHLDWWLALPALGKVSLIENWGWKTALMIQVLVLVGLYLLVRILEIRRNHSLAPLTQESASSFSQRLIFGPWPLSWGIIGLAIFSTLTLLLAGHPWSITFAFGLWGAKFVDAIGFDVANWSYWSSGYPSMALHSSVLADVTSIMNFGIVFGAILAAALAGRFAPAKKIKKSLLLTAVVGGLLLGYGSRLAFGCNIGGMFAGVATGSLHGWLWMIAGFTGTIAGVYIRILLGIDKPLRSEQ